MDIVTCKECGFTEKYIKLYFHKHKYKDGVLCGDCYNTKYPSSKVEARYAVKTEVDIHTACVNPINNQPICKVCGHTSSDTSFFKKINNGTFICHTCSSPRRSLYTISHKCLRQRRERGATGTHTMEEFEAKIRKSDYHCYYCGTKLTRGELCREHLIPICRGGSNDIENIEPACWSCNSRKGKKTESEYIEYLRLKNIKLV